MNNISLSNQVTDELAEWLQVSTHVKCFSI